jgi:hypothetical protein
MAHSEKSHPLAMSAATRPNVADVLLNEAFTDRDLDGLRMSCHACALGLGLSDVRASRFAEAVAGIMLNVLRCGGGSGALVLLQDGAGRVVVEVTGRNHAAGTALRLVTTI